MCSRLVDAATHPVIFQVLTGCREPLHGVIPLVRGLGLYKQLLSITCSSGICYKTKQTVYLYYWHWLGRLHNAVCNECYYITTSTLVNIKHDFHSANSFDHYVNWCLSCYCCRYTRIIWNQRFDSQHSLRYYIFTYLHFYTSLFCCYSSDFSFRISDHQ